MDTVWSIPQDGELKIVMCALLGDVGRLLGELGYCARIVVKRADGGAIIDGERARVDKVMLDVAEVGTHAPEVGDHAATRHLAKARERIAAKTAATARKRTG